MMTDFMKLNGTAVRTTGMYRRSIEQPGGPPLAELELVIIVRGSMANRSLKQLLAQEPVLIDLPKGAEMERFIANIQDVQVAASGTGESAAYRYDLTLRETPESAEKRAAEAAVTTPVVPKTTHVVRETQPYDDDPNGPLNLSEVKVGGDTAVWATALKQMKTPTGARPEPPPEPPLTSVELAGIEAVLTNLRLDAMIDLLEIRGIIQRADIESHFTKLVTDRFVAEATPVVGEKAAKRAQKDLLG
jgi:hypothetical protein